MYDLRSQHENAGDAWGEDCNQQRAVVGKLTHRDLASALLHALHREWEGGGRNQHGGDGRGALTETVADGEQSRRGHPQHIAYDEAGCVEADPAERASDDERNAVVQRMIDDFAIERPKAAAIA